MQNEGTMRNSHTQDTNGKWEKPTSYFCLAVGAFGEKEIYSEEQQAAGTHNGAAGEGGLIYGGAKKLNST